MSKQQILATLLLAAITITFWTGSRYPRLNAKAAMAGEIPLSDTLSFERVIDYEETAPVLDRIYYSLINWISANKKGMMFGFLFGAAFLTLLPTIRFKLSKSSFKNSLIGMFTGAPLGVCVNCAAPIGNAVYRALGKIEISLATMVSSPTLNIVVLTMLFTMFPTHLIVLKLFFTFATLFLVIPYLARKHELDSADACNLKTGEKAALISGATGVLANESHTWIGAFVSVCRSFGKNLLWIVFATGPLMLVAGALGVTLTQLVDLNMFMAKFNFIGLVAVAIIGTFLPAPIALDLILAQAFLVAGVNDAYVMALLFTLGIYSIFACFIVWKSMSRRVALTLYASVVVMGVCSGYLAKFYADAEYTDSLQLIEQEFSSFFSLPKAYGKPIETSPKSYDMIPNQTKFVGKRSNVLVYKMGHENREKNFDQEFSMIWGESVGLYRPIEFSILDFFTPFYFSRGMTSGDFNNDGFEDIAIASVGGFRLYKNMGGGTYKSLFLKNIKGLSSSNMMLVAFVDVDNDGWLDLFGSSYGQGEVFYIKNERGRFQHQAIPLPNPRAITTNAASFADIDSDGDLDFVFGNWYMGFTTKLPPVQARNYLAINNMDNFKVRALPAVPGETLTTLFSDFNTDGTIDLVVGNDFSRPDVFYLGDGKGQFTQTNEKKLVPYSTKYTMSVDTADINNDLRLDMYLAQITGDFDKTSASDFVEYAEDYCEEITNKDDKKICRDNIAVKDIMLYRKIQIGNVKKCKKLRPKKRAQDCMAQVMTLVAIKEGKKELCDKIPSRYKRNRFWCDNFFAAEPSPFNAKLPYVRQIEKRNILLVANSSGGFDELAKKMKVDMSGWSWNAKFADLNNDSWQDLYVVNGYWLTPQRYNNTVFINQKGKGFVKPENGYGLDDTMDVSSYLYSDVDNDGDLDVITSPVNGPLKLLRNGEGDNNAVTFSLRDEQGNSHCIGCKIYITYGDKLRQVREIKGGGGFQSFDIPKAHFGMGVYNKVKALSVIWSDGSKWELDADLDANEHYYILRPSAIN